MHKQHKSSEPNWRARMLIRNATEGCAQLHSKVPKVGPGVWSCHPLAATYTRKRLSLQLMNVRDQTLTRISPSIMSGGIFGGGGSMMSFWHVLHESVWGPSVDGGCSPLQKGRIRRSMIPFTHMDRPKGVCTEHMKIAYFRSR
jgi:hypothetical protein